MDSTVKKIVPADQDLSRIQDNLAAPLQQLLDFVNGSGSQGQAELLPALSAVAVGNASQNVVTPALIAHGRTDGPYKPNQPTVILGDPATANVAQRDSCLFSYGQIVAMGSKVLADGFVIVPQVAGAAFRTTNVGGTANAFIIDDAGNVTARSLSLITGMKSILPVGAYWNSSYTASANVQLLYTVANATGGGVGNTPVILKPEYAGSIVGMSLNQAGNVTGTNFLLIYKNGANSFVWNAGIGNNNSTFWAVFAKGTPALTFAPGDTLAVYFQNSAAGNCQVSAHLTVEMGN